ncbi:hypothetical protein COCSADRAFT_81878 [Bipolaris sorokiniana ND90Pr]|uniref:NADP-dependent oxidoreductase domain-containing protein n=1 Tax=Cochliobolus sativus (strain ND90Pr / ATCC 201652) TaxID=665912 RepID=M2TCS2_COCSN|nr:uncharacterized protein COCSADRAFT_81878 [Bipolaris sorokiniana ND90Pr]EMD67051.1 hypothetical protein COCSADRAFT_81878 [Bipolaris sorokiniana ND90Pr]
MLLDFSRTTLGTANVNGTRCIEYIQRGLTAGYRSIDTAQAYRNEEAVGQAIREHSVPRKQIHVMTKVSTGFKQNPGSLNEVKDAVEGSLTRLKIGYVDAMLIHHPGDDTVDPEAAYRRRVTWQGLETLVELGKVRNIGVSNFNIAHLRELKQYARILPVVNQIELHPWCQQRELVNHCQKEKIPLQAYLAISRNSQESDEGLKALAKKYNVSAAAILICYSVRKGFLPIVKAEDPQHLVSNLKAEKLCIEDEDLAVIDSWDMGKSGSISEYLDLL